MGQTQLEAMAAWSSHPVAAVAVGEVVGAILEGVGDRPSVAVVTVAPSFAGATADISAVIRRVLRPSALIGAVATAIEPSENRRTISLWAAWQCSAHAFAIRPQQTRPPSSPSLLYPSDTPHAVVVLADRSSLTLRDVSEAVRPNAQLIGGFVTPPRTRATFVIGSEIFHDGGVGLAFDSTTRTTLVTAAGVRPLDRPMEITRSERNVLIELEHRPAYDSLASLIAVLGEDVRAQLRQHLLIGFSSAAGGPPLIRSIVGFERETGALAISDEVPLGARAQFLVRDPSFATEELERSLTAEYVPRNIHSRGATGALVFAARSLATALFEDDASETSVVAEYSGAAVGGAYCDGEFVQQNNQFEAQTHTASVLLLG